MLCILYHEVHLLENILILIVSHRDLTVLPTKMCFVLIPNLLTFRSMPQEASLHFTCSTYISLKLTNTRMPQIKDTLQQDFTNYEKLWAVARQS